MSSLKKVIDSTSRNVEHVTTVYKKRVLYVLECGHSTTREVDRHVSNALRLKCKSCAMADGADS